MFTNSFGYTAAGDLATLTDGRGKVTQWHFDQYGRATNKVDALNRKVFRYQYDANGRLTARWSAAKGTASFGYNAVGNLLSIAYPVSPQISMSYDALNRLTNRVDALGTMRYSYYPSGLLASEDGPWDNDTVSYSYTNLLLATLTLLQPNGPAWTNRYSHDLALRLTNITAPAGRFGYVYYTGTNGTAPASGLIQNVSLPNGAGISYSYDNLARKLGTYLNNSQSQSLNSHTYVYNKGSQRERQTRSDQGVSGSVDYLYDALGQLTNAAARMGNGDLQLNQQMGYGYDPAGNLQVRRNQDLTQNFNVNEVNQLGSLTRSDTLTISGTYQGQVTQVTVNGTNATLSADHTFAAPGLVATNGVNTFTAIANDGLGHTATNTITVNIPATVNFQYDNNGNLTSDGLRSFYYDDENRLTNVTVAGCYRSEFAYDGQGRRRRTRDYSLVGGNAVLTNEVRYVYDSNLVIQERDGNNQPLVTYTHGLDLSVTLEGAGGIGGLLARSQDYSAGVWSTHHYYHADGNGNITYLLDSNQNRAASYQYDPYGYLLAPEGPMAVTNHYRFASKEYHVNSGLYYFEGRYYDPNLQRFINQDPIGEIGDVNLYRYVHNDPIVLVDPYGLLDPGLSPSAATAALAKLSGATASTSGTLSLGVAIGWGLPVAVGGGLAGYGVSRLPVIGGGTVADAYGDIIYNLFYPKPKPLPAPPKPPRPPRNPGLTAPCPDPGDADRDRRRAVELAWKMEQQLVSSTGRGTRDWTELEIKELLATGKVSGYQGHHINSVSSNPQQAANPNNIQFLKPSEHLDVHGGNWNKSTWGPLLTR